jgi:hypothetical protein
MRTHAASVISEQAKELLRMLLAPSPLYKGDGEHEIGHESAKREIKQSLEAFIGGPL